ncbi:MAG: hypothetical protein QOK37_2225 [Thermoanaerobaculia bacterium]|jgi:hypothetical protein|nr:hypothetical protein [Thermoanaerobaculia bacterium]
MRTSIAFAILFRAALAFGQPAIDPEVATDPLPSRGFSLPTNAPAVAMARDNKGVAVAWMMAGAGGGNRIHVVRLDGTAHFTGAVREIPLFATYEADASFPSIAAAPDGNGFTLAWLEAPFYSITVPAPSTWNAVFCQLDSDLNPSPPRFLAEAIRSPVIVRSEKSTWMTARGLLWEMRPDGSRSDFIIPGPTASDMAIAKGAPQIAGSQNVVGSFTCSSDPGCTVQGGPFRGFCYQQCRKYQYNYTLQFVALYTASASPVFPFLNDASPAVASNGRDVLVGWFSGEQSKGGQVAVARMTPDSATNVAHAFDQPHVVGNFGPDAGLTRPDIATDGQRYLIVWRSTMTIGGNHDILGASIAPDGTVTPLSIATSSDDERDPSVIALGTGSFLVAYEKLSLGERRLAGRTITFDDRRHAVR